MREDQAPLHISLTLTTIVCCSVLAHLDAQLFILQTGSSGKSDGLIWKASLNWEQRTSGSKVPSLLAWLSDKEGNLCPFLTPLLLSWSPANTVHLRTFFFNCKSPNSCIWLHRDLFADLKLITQLTYVFLFNCKSTIICRYMVIEICLWWRVKKRHLS